MPLNSIESEHTRPRATWRFALQSSEQKRCLQVTLRRAAKAPHITEARTHYSNMPRRAAQYVNPFQYTVSSLRSSLREHVSIALFLSRCQEKQPRASKSFRQCDACKCSRWCDIMRMYAVSYVCPRDLKREMELRRSSSSLVCMCVYMVEVHGKSRDVCARGGAPVAEPIAAALPWHCGREWRNSNRSVFDAKVTE